MQPSDTDEQERAAPTHDDIRAQIARILTSSEFPRAGRSLPRGQSYLRIKAIELAPLGRLSLRSNGRLELLCV
jgi:hypothetical protein